MPATTTTPASSSTLAIDQLTINITQEIHIKASLEATFSALLEQLGPSNETEEGNKLPMKIEPWPGGRWYRDLGQHNGHFWAVVQAIKRPTLFELSGPLFMSNPAISNVQYRLKEADGGTLLTVRHTAFGLVQEDQRAGLTQWWPFVLESVRKRVEAA